MTITCSKKIKAVQKVIFHCCQIFLLLVAHMRLFVLKLAWIPKLRIYKYVASNTKRSNFNIKFSQKSFCKTCFHLNYESCQKQNNN